MKMTTRGRYGLRAMLELARCHGGPPVLMSALAGRERLSRKYLHRLLAALKSAGLVRSIRGARGGFQLGAEPSQIRLSQILQAVEGPLSLVECVRRASACKRSSTCTARQVWRELSGAFEQLLEGVTLGNLVESEAKAGAAGGSKNLKSADLGGRQPPHPPLSKGGRSRPSLGRGGRSGRTSPIKGRASRGRAERICHSARGQTSKTTR